MNIGSKSLLFTALLTSIAIQCGEVERKEDAAQKELDKKLYDAVECTNVDSVQKLLLQKANPNCDFPVGTHWSYVWARRPLVKALCNLNSCIEHPITKDEATLKKHTESCLAIVRLLLEHKANPDVTMASTTDLRAFEHHLKFVYINRNRLATKLAPSYTALELLLAHGATTDLNSYTFPLGIHSLAEDDSELQKILANHAQELAQKITVGSSLPRDPSSVVVEYLG